MPPVNTENVRLEKGVAAWTFSSCSCISTVSIDPSGRTDSTKTQQRLQTRNKEGKKEPLRKNENNMPNNKHKLNKPK